MLFGSCKRIGFAALVFTCVLRAQQAGAPAEPRFEVVSIREVPRNAPIVERTVEWTPVLPGGQYVDSRAMLIEMIGFAYDVKFTDFHLLRLPNWAKNQAYEVAAKPAEDFPVLSPGENQWRVKLMMRAMLADRFHLRLHAETRQERIFHLEVARGGFKIKGVYPPVAPAKEGPVTAAYSDDHIRMIGKKSTMAGLATALTTMLGTQVVDQTGQKGYYDIDVRWTAQPAGGLSNSTAFGAEGIALLISNLQSEFGLQLTKATGPAEYWAVDHVEPPTEN